MGFYGNITNTSKTQFQFDRTYPNRATMEKNLTTDGIYAGRYVLIEYDTDLSKTLDTFMRVYISNGMAYTASDFSLVSRLNKKDIGFGDIVFTSNDYVLGLPLVPTDCIFWKCTSILDENSNEPATFVRVVSSESSNYIVNFNIDTAKYGESRGYDSTVWQKVYVNNNEKYVQIAELNSVVPTFDIAADAPTVYPILPHFDVLSTNVYYKLHWQPQWGMRLKEATLNKTLSNDKKVYPSDEKTAYTKYIYDPATGSQTSDIVEYNSAVYYNKAGFLKDVKTHYDGEYRDTIQVAPTGISGNTYNVHNPNDSSNTNNILPDIQEFKILLPSLGNTISDIWDLIYGYGLKVQVDETYSGNTDNLKRFRDIEWKDAVTGEENTELGGMTRDLNTLAGCINKVHDLMGMIITDKDNATLNEEWFSKNYIYKDGNNYYRIHKFPTYTTSTIGDLNLPNRDNYTSDQEYNSAYREIISTKLQDTEYFLIKDSSSPNYRVETLNEKSLSALNASTIIGYQSGYGYEFLQIPDMPGKMATIYGLILLMKNLLEVEDSETRDTTTVTGAINTLNDIIKVFEDLVPGEFLICDADGHVNSANWTTEQPFSYCNYNTLEPQVTEISKENLESKTDENRWISLSLDKENQKIELKHIFNEVGNTNTISNKNDIITTPNKGINNSTDDVLKLYTPIVDAMGHVVGKNIETVTLPYGFKKITTNGEQTSETKDMVPAAGTSIANNTQDEFSINVGNKWLHASMDNTTDTLTLAHEVHNFESGSANTKYGLETNITVSDLDKDNKFKVPAIKFDEAGHITMAETHTVSIPENFDKIAITVTGKDSTTFNASSIATILEADTLTDMVTFNVGNRWIQLVGDASTDKVSIYHAAPGNLTNSTKTGAETPNYGEAFNIPEVKYDEAGHISGIATHTVTFPTPSLNDLTATDSSVITGLTMTDGTLAITLTNANVGTRTLTGYSEGTDNTDIENTDTINIAFGKLLKQIHEEETNRTNSINNLNTELSKKISDEEIARINAINALDVQDNAVDGEYVSAVSEIDGKISVSRKSLPTYSLTTGTDNGTVTFNDTIVSVAGLKSAAYTDSSAYAGADILNKTTFTYGTENKTIAQLFEIVANLTTKVATLTTELTKLKNKVETEHPTVTEPEGA